MQTHVSRVLAAAAVAVALAGCLSSTGLTGARSVGTDNVEFAFAVSFMPDLSDNIVGLPALDVVVRYGLSDTADLGFRLNSLGMFNIDTKVELIDHQDSTVALMPTIGVNWGSVFSDTIRSNGVPIQLGLSVLGDVHVGDEATITIAPSYSVLLDTHTGNTHHLLGGELNGAFDVGGGFRLQPFITGHWGVGVASDALMATILTGGVATRYAP